MQRERAVRVGQPALDVVRHDDSRRARGAPDQGLDLAESRGVEVGAGLVEQEELGLVEHASHNGRALGLTRREGAHELARSPLEADLGEQLADPLVRRPGTR